MIKKKLVRNKEKSIECYAKLVLCIWQRMMYDFLYIAGNDARSPVYGREWCAISCICQRMIYERTAIETVIQKNIVNTTDWIYEQGRRLRENENTKDIYTLHQIETLKFIQHTIGKKGIGKFIILMAYWILEKLTHHILQ